MQAIQAIALVSFFCLLLLRVESYAVGGDGIQCSSPNCPADCGTITGPEGCLVCDCSGSVGAVGRPNDDEPGTKGNLRGCPENECYPGCDSLQRPIDCPNCECPSDNNFK